MRERGELLTRIQKLIGGFWTLVTLAILGPLIPPVILLLEYCRWNHHRNTTPDLPEVTIE